MFKQVNWMNKKTKKAACTYEIRLSAVTNLFFH